MDENFSTTDILNAYNINEIAANGSISVTTLISSGVSATQLTLAGYSLIDLINGGS